MESLEAGVALGAGEGDLAVDVECVRLHGDVGFEAVALHEQLKGDVAVLEDDGVA